MPICWFHTTCNILSGKVLLSQYADRFTLHMQHKNIDRGYGPHPTGAQLAGLDYIHLIETTNLLQIIHMKCVTRCSIVAYHSTLMLCPCTRKARKRRLTSTTHDPREANQNCNGNDKRHNTNNQKQHSTQDDALGTTRLLSYAAHCCY